MKDTTGVTDSTGTNPSGNLCVAEGRRGPSWRGWVLSILAAILLSVTATLLLGGGLRIPVGGRGGRSRRARIRSRKKLLPAGGRREVSGASGNIPGILINH